MIRKSSYPVGVHVKVASGAEGAAAETLALNAKLANSESTTATKSTIMETLIQRMVA